MTGSTKSRSPGNPGLPPAAATGPRLAAHLPCCLVPALALWLIWATAARAQTIESFVGSSSSDSVYGAVACDVDLDGRVEIVVLDHMYDNGASGNTGALGVFGSAGGSDTPFSSADYLIVGEAADDQLGYMDGLAAVGDVNGDGVQDIAVGSGSHDSARGAVYLIPGSTDAGAFVNTGGSLTAGVAGGGAVKYTGENAGDYAGFAVKGAGDANGDGIADLALSAPGFLGSRGAVYLVLGSTDPGAFVNAGGTLAAGMAGGSVFRYAGQNPGDSAGASLAGAGDGHGDGYADLLVGAPYSDRAATDAGSVYLVPGRSSLASLNLGRVPPRFVVSGLASEDHVGWTFCASGAGDVDADGHDDIVVGAIGHGSMGAAWVLRGAPAGLVTSDLASSSAVRFLGLSADDTTGSAAGVGDVNGDGYDDILIGAPAAGPLLDEAGYVFLVYGAATADYRGGHLPYVTPDLAVTFYGEAASDGLGIPMAAGDVDLDGHADFFLGAQGSDDGGSHAGEVYLIHGMDPYPADAVQVF